MQPKIAGRVSVDIAYATRVQIVPQCVVCYVLRYFRSVARGAKYK